MILPSAVRNLFPRSPNGVCVLGGGGRVKRPTSLLAPWTRPRASIVPLSTQYPVPYSICFRSRTQNASEFLIGICNHLIDKRTGLLNFVAKKPSRILLFQKVMTYLVSVYFCYVFYLFNLHAVWRVISLRKFCREINSASGHLCNSHLLVAARYSIPTRIWRHFNHGHVAATAV